MEEAGMGSKNNQAWHPEPRFLLCWVAVTADIEQQRGTEWEGGAIS